MNPVQEAIQKRLDAVEDQVRVFLETYSDQIGKPGSPLERDSRFCGYPNAIEHFLHDGMLQLAHDLDDILYDHGIHLEVRTE